MVMAFRLGSALPRQMTARKAPFNDCILLRRLVQVISALSMPVFVVTPTTKNVQVPIIILMSAISQSCAFSFEFYAPNNTSYAALFSLVANWRL